MKTQMILWAIFIMLMSFELSLVLVTLLAFVAFVGKSI